MRGGSNPRQAAKSSTSEQTPDPGAVRAPEKKRVLFVCVGNSCRSQMAEGFARAYGHDVIVPQSAGLTPAAIVAPLTRVVLAERHIRIPDQFPKGLDEVLGEMFDIVINMSGVKLAAQEGSAANVIDWPVLDPIGQKEAVYRSVAEEIERRVMGLILEIRSAPK